MPVLRDMGKWNKDKDSYHGNTLYYKNVDAVEKVIRYISRTRWNEDRANELVLVGGAGIDAYASIDVIISQFLQIQNFYNINQRNGRRLIHLVYSFSDEEFNNELNANYALVNLIARGISAYFYNNGFQVFYGVHYDPSKRVHIHFAINTISYLTGKKYRAQGEHFKELMMVCNTIYYQNINLKRKE